MYYKEIKDQIIAKAWKDPAFKKRLIKEPREVFREYGVEIPQHVKVMIEEEGKRTLHLVVPQMPGNMEGLSDKEMQDIAGGTTSLTSSEITC